MPNEIHDPLLVGQALVLNSPDVPTSVVNKEYVDSTRGLIYISDVASVDNSKTVGNIVYNAPTVPVDVMIAEVSTNTLDLVLSFTLYQSGDVLSPNTVSCVTSTGVYTAQVQADPVIDRKFFGTIQISITTTETIEIKTSESIRASLFIKHLASAPSIITFDIGAYPDSQTHVSEDQQIPISGTVPNRATSLSVLATGAAKSGVVTFGQDDSAGNSLKTFTGYFVVSGINTDAVVSSVIYDVLGNVSAEYTSPVVNIDQTSPIINTPVIVYPVNQSALNNTDTANISAVVTNYDELTYSSSDDLLITDPDIYNDTKTVTRVSGDEVTVPNYFITAKLLHNGKQAQVSVAIVISTTVPQAMMTITKDTAKLLSSATGQDYPVTLTTTSLYGVPVVTASSGNFINAWTKVDDVWTNVLRIVDASPKGDHAFSVTLTGSNGSVGTMVTNGLYTVGGFGTRTLPVPAFSRVVDIGTHIHDISAVTVSLLNSYELTLQSSTLDKPDGYTIVDSAGDYTLTGSFIYLTDLVMVGANSSGTLTLEIQEG